MAERCHHQILFCSVAGLTYKGTTRMKINFVHFDRSQLLVNTCFSYWKVDQHLSKRKADKAFWFYLPSQIFRSYYVPGWYSSILWFIGRCHGTRAKCVTTVRLECRFCYNPDSEFLRFRSFFIGFVLIIKK